MTNSIFEATKILVLKIVEDNIDLPAKELWETIQKELPNTPKYILASCLKEIVSE